MIASTIEAEKLTPQMGLFQLKILKPSIMPNGIRLKIAMNEFIQAPKKTMLGLSLKKLDMKPTARNVVARTMFVDGPAIAVFPMVSLDPTPAIMTAPGEMTLNRGRRIEINVIKAPVGVRRNSAHNP